MVSGNGNQGLQLSDSALAIGNVAEGNFIGTDVTGTLDLGNDGTGIQVGAGNGHLIAGNVVSGNGGNGLFVSTSTTLSVRIEGNRIGTNAQGTAKIANDLHGISTASGVGASLVSVIGGETATQGNVISGNGGNGVMVGPFEADGVELLNNYIGTDLTGAVDLGNQGHGVEAAGSSLVIGELGAGNLISGNQGAGVRLRDVGNVIQANVISANDADGVKAVGLSQGNAILTNSIFGNAGLGIDLNDDGVTANDLRDPDVGPNLRQNFPEVTGVGAGGTNVVGTLNSRPNSVYTIQLFENAQCDPSEHGEGETFLVATQVTTDASGDAGFAVTLPTAVPGGHVVTATATDSQDNTSEHSRCKTPPPTATIVVEKQTEPDGSSEEFSFTGDVVGAIGDGETIEVSVSAPGTYSSREAVPTGWDLKGITCDDSDSSGAVGTATATFRVIANETVTCTFTNTSAARSRSRRRRTGSSTLARTSHSSSPGPACQPAASRGRRSATRTACSSSAARTSSPGRATGCASRPCPPASRRSGGSTASSSRPTTRTRAGPHRRIWGLAATTSRSLPARRAPSTSTTRGPVATRARSATGRTGTAARAETRPPPPRRTAARRPASSSSRTCFPSSSATSPSRRASRRSSSCRSRTRAGRTRQRRGLRARRAASGRSLQPGSRRGDLRRRATGRARRADAPRRDRLHRLRRLPRLEVEGARGDPGAHARERRSTATTTASSAELALSAPGARSPQHPGQLSSRGDLQRSRFCSSRSTRFTVAREVPAISASCSWVSGMTESCDRIERAQLSELAEHAALPLSVRLEQRVQVAQRLQVLAPLPLEHLPRLRQSELTRRRRTS